MVGKAENFLGFDYLLTVNVCYQRINFCQKETLEEDWMSNGNFQLGFEPRKKPEQFIEPGSGLRFSKLRLN